MEFITDPSTSGNTVNNESSMTIIDINDEEPKNDPDEVTHNLLLALQTNSTVEVEITAVNDDPHEQASVSDHEKEVIEKLEVIIKYLKNKSTHQAVSGHDDPLKDKKILAKLKEILETYKDKSADVDEQIPVMEDGDINTTKYLMKLNGAGGFGVLAAHHLNTYVGMKERDILFEVSTTATMTGFVACLISLRFLKRSKKASKIFEKVGSIATVVAFASLAIPYLGTKLMWVLVVGAIVAIVSLLLY